MNANTRDRENELVGSTIAWLRDRLPDSWEIEAQPGSAAAGASPDGVIQIKAQNVFATLAIEARIALAPRDVDRLMGGIGRSLRALAPHLQILIVAPWLSERTRGLLRAERLNYIDATGNAWIQLDNPALFLETKGADRDPAPPRRSRARARGPKAGRLLRTLVDVRPPYGVRELAGAAGLAPGYVSSLLDALDEEALIERGRRGRVEEVDISGLLLRWTESYDLLESNEALTFVAPRGSGDTLARLREISSPAIVTGSFAAVRLAPVTAPALLCVYTDDLPTVARDLELLPADQGANVILLRPSDPVVWTRATVADGVRYVAASQAVVDCLTGPGRMPAEGEAVLAWMLDHEDRWRDAALTNDDGRDDD